MAAPAEIDQGLHVTHHAVEQYVARVEPVAFETAAERVALLAVGAFRRRRFPWGFERQVAHWETGPTVLVWEGGKLLSLWPEGYFDAGEGGEA